MKSKRFTEKEFDKNVKKTQDIRTLDGYSCKLGGMKFVVHFKNGFDPMKSLEEQLQLVVVGGNKTYLKTNDDVHGELMNVTKFFECLTYSMIKEYESRKKCEEEDEKYKKQQELENKKCSYNTQTLLMIDDINNTTGKPVTFEQLLSRLDIDKNELKKILDKMLRDGIIFEPNPKEYMRP